MKQTPSKAKIIALYASFALLTACGGSNKPTVNLAPVLPTAEQAAVLPGSLVFDPITSDVPYPNDILFAGSTDGTLNIPVANASDYSDPINALNALDGFATTGALSVNLSKAFEADNAEFASALRLYEVTTDAATKAVTGVSATLVYGVDYVASISAQTKLVVMPLKPLKPKTSYLVVVTNDLTDADNLAAQPSQTYAYLKKTTALVDGAGQSVTPGLPTSFAAKLEPLRQLTQAQLAYAEGAGVSRDKVVMSWSFSTQSIGDVLDKTLNNVSNNSLAVQSAGINTSTVGGQGKADLYAGTLTVPYYLAVPSTTNPAAPLVSHWQGQTGGELTRFSVAQGDSPKKVADQTIAVLMTLPNATSGKTQPAAGWPVVIFQHGITQNRSNLLAIADALASAGYAAVAIDLPLHGIGASDATSALRLTGVTERTFEMDLVTQDAAGSITASTADSVVDSSGRHFIQLASLLTTRDNLRQGISDLVQLKAALSQVQGVSLDANNVSFVGHSLGGMVGAGFVKRAPDLKAAVFAMSGGQASYILASSPTFSPEIIAGLSAKGLAAGSADFNRFLLAAQTAVESGDPVNMVAGITVPTLVFEVAGDGNTGTEDQVIPNRVATAPLAGTEPWISLQGLNSVSATGVVSGGKGVLRYTAGTHASLLDPSASQTTTVSMQQAMASFIASGGTAIQMSDNSTVKQP